MNRIPEISDERLETLAARIKPVIRFQATTAGRFESIDRNPEGKPFYIEPVDFRRTAFTWDPKPTVEAEDIVPYKTIETFHTYGAPVFFKPSIAEVLAQIPEEDLERAVAFETGHHDMSAEHCLSDGYHWAATVLYERSG